jgi:hypothetical protein
MIILGVDIGQKRDPTAICVAETVQREQLHYLIRHLERLPLDTPYPAVAARISALASALAERTGFKPEVFVDATGVGAPVMDLLREQAPEVRSAVAVLFTAGSGKKPHRHEKKLTLGKARLVSRLQALLRVGRLHLPKTREADALAKELLTYEIRVDDNGHARFGAFKVGTHDDLVTALGLAVHQEQGST